MKKLFATLLALGLLLTGCSTSTPTTAREPDIEIITVEPETVEEEYKGVLPVEEIISFYNEQDIVAAIPSYDTASEEAQFEVDKTHSGSLVIWITGSTNEEMNTYKQTLLDSDWTFITEEDNNQILKYYDTKAFVSLSDLNNCIGLSFYTAELVTAMNCEEAIKAVGKYFGRAGLEREEDSSWFFNYAMDEEKASTAYMKEFVIKCTPTEFKSKVEWTRGVFEDGTIFESCTLTNEINTTLQYYVYSYVIQGTYSSCIEVYSYLGQGD